MARLGADSLMSQRIGSPQNTAVQKCTGGHELKICEAGANAKNPGRKFYCSDECGAFKWVGDKYTPKCKPKDDWKEKKQEEPAPVAFKIQKQECEKFICIAPQNIAEFADEVYIQFRDLELFGDNKIENWLLLCSLLVCRGKELVKSNTSS